MDSDLLKALLAMDAYNRGYNEGVKGLGSVGSKIGTATIITDSLQTPSTSNSISVGFYGLAYKLTSGETIISYRGTDVPASWFWSDAPGSDIWYGWTTGAGSPSSEQAELAIKFYQSVAGTGTDPRTANISLTGHSLGGGLAGFIGDLYHKTGVLFDNMAFELAADKTYAYATVINTEKVTATPQDDKLIYSDAFQNAKVTLIDAGAGRDTIDFSKSTKGVSYTLNGKIGSVQTANFENATGTQYADAIIGNATNNIFIGNGGNDVLNGNGGTDLLYGGSGKDLFSLGNNTFVKDATPDGLMDFTSLALMHKSSYRKFSEIV